MAARTFTGKAPFLLPLSFVVAMVLAVFVAFALGAGGAPKAMAEGEAPTVGEGAPEDPSFADLAPTVVPISTESPEAVDSTEITPVVAEPPTDTEADAPSEVTPPPFTEVPVVEPDPTAAPTPTTIPTETAETSVDRSGAAVRPAAESTAVEIDSCVLASGSNNVVGHGEAIVYTCAATITIVPVPSGLAEIVLDWGVSADEASGWTAELRRETDAGNGAGDLWSPGAAPGLEVIEVLGGADDVDGHPTDDVFVYEVHFDVRLTAPDCGGPNEADVKLTPSVLPTIDGIEGWRRHGELFRQIRPSLQVAAPAPVLSRTATGQLDDEHSPLRFSHADQVVDAGTLGLSVVSGYCGGWTVSISATDFVLENGNDAFASANLLLTATGTGQEIPVSGAQLTMGNAAQSIVFATHGPLPAGTYAYTFDLTLLIPGGTPPGTYTSTVTVTTSAAP